MNNTEQGKAGENMACKYLTQKGFNIITTNYRAGRNEIDIIAKIDDLLVFIEVKMKSSVTYGNPEEAVNNSKASRILEAAETYIYEKNWEKDIRFDVISIVKTNEQWDIKHFEDAFY